MHSFSLPSLAGTSQKVDAIFCIIVRHSAVVKGLEPLLELEGLITVNVVYVIDVHIYRMFTFNIYTPTLDTYSNDMGLRTSTRRENSNALA